MEITFLNTVIFLPLIFYQNHTKSYVYFQIVGVDHKIDTSGWSTTYTTQYRVKKVKI